MNITRFSYPDIPYIDNRVLYDYIFQLDKVIRKLAATINTLETKVQRLEING